MALADDGTATAAYGRIAMHDHLIGAEIAHRQRRTAIDHDRGRRAQGRRAGARSGREIRSRPQRSCGSGSKGCAPAPKPVPESFRHGVRDPRRGAVFGHVMTMRSVVTLDMQAKGMKQPYLPVERRMMETVAPARALAPCGHRKNHPYQFPGLTQSH